MSSLSVVAMFFTIAVCFIFPIGTYLYLKGKHPKHMIGALVAGALSFYIPQMVIRVPLLQLILPTTSWYKTLSTHTFFYALFLGLSAALFETVGRTFTIGVLLKKSQSYKTGLIHGLGHGGIEAIFLVGLNYIIFAIYGILYLKGNPTPLSSMFPGEQQTLIQGILFDTPANLFLAAGVERLMTMILHMALSLIVMTGFIYGKPLKYALITIALHTFVDTSTVLLASVIDNTWIIELLIAVVAIFSVLIIRYLKTGIPTYPPIDEGEKAVEEGF